MWKQSGHWHSNVHHERPSRRNGGCRCTSMWRHYFDIIFLPCYSHALLSCDSSNLQQVPLKYIACCGDLTLHGCYGINVIRNIILWTVHYTLFQVERDKLFVRGAKQATLLLPSKGRNNFLKCGQRSAYILFSLHPISGDFPPLNPKSAPDLKHFLTDIS